MNLLKTDHKTCYSYSLGKFTLISGSNFCADHKYFSVTCDQVIRYESNLAAMIVDKGYRVTFDLAVKVGRLRYDDHRQLHEIQSYLKCSPAMIDLPISTLGMIAKRFLEFCQLLHQNYEHLILDDINRNGCTSSTLTDRPSRNVADAAWFSWIADLGIFWRVRWLIAKATTLSRKL